MTLSIGTFLFVCPLLFLAGLVDAIGGGGGLISLPAYLIAVFHTPGSCRNKLSSTCGTTLATVRFIKSKLVNFKLTPSVISAIIGSSVGAKLSLMMDEKIMEYILFAVLPLAAFIVLNKSYLKITRRRTYIKCKLILPLSSLHFHRNVRRPLRTGHGNF